MPAIQRLRDLEPMAYIALSCPGALYDLWRHNPFLNEVIPVEGRISPRLLRRQEFDLAIVFPDSFRPVWECYRAGIPRRVGFAGAWRRKLLTDIVAEPHEEQPVRDVVPVDGISIKRLRYPVLRHQAERYLDVIAYLGGNRSYTQPKIWLAPGEMPSLTKFLHEGFRCFFGIHASASCEMPRRWPLERFVDAATRISDEIPCRWLLFGGPDEVEFANTLESNLKRRLTDDRAVVNVAGKTTLMELCELLKFCQLLLTNDTGPMHLADALGTPLVAVFGSTSPERTGPTGKHSVVVRQKVECSPCFLRECPIDLRCMQRVSVEEVVAATLTLWRSLEHTHQLA